LRFYAAWADCSHSIKVVDDLQNLAGEYEKAVLFKPIQGAILGVISLGCDTWRAAVDFSIRRPN